jgi:hypothetical protein
VIAIHAVFGTDYLQSLRKDADASTAGGMKVVPSSWSRRAIAANCCEIAKQ